MTPLDPEDVRWIAWRNEPRGKEGKPTKVPYGRGGRPAKADDEATWLVRAEAENLARRIVNGVGGGVGYELGDVGNDLFIAGIDLDSCLKDGVLAPWAAAILDLDATYA
jgi:primase-polymerase (primpol)-like protein